MKMNQALCATAVSLALAMSTAYAADDNPYTADPMTGKQKATAIGATTGAVAGAVVGGPVGAVVGGVAGGVVGHQGTDAAGRVSTSKSSTAPNAPTAYSNPDPAIRDAQTALNMQGYNPGAIDGQLGPNTQNAIRRFQADKGLAQTGSLDGATMAALGINK